MRCVPIILLLLVGCSTLRQSQRPSAYKYETNAKALLIYLRAYGDGYQRGCQMITTDIDALTPDMVYTNGNPLLQSAGVDGFDDGKQAARNMVRDEIKALRKNQR